MQLCLTILPISEFERCGNHDFYPLPLGVKAYVLSNKLLNC